MVLRRDELRLAKVDGSDEPSVWAWLAIDRINVSDDKRRALVGVVVEGRSAATVVAWEPTAAVRCSLAAIGVEPEIHESAAESGVVVCPELRRGGLS